MGVLGENIIKHYGDRLVRTINSFVSKHNLHSYTEQRPLKRMKVANDDDDDEFGDDLDNDIYDSVPLG